MLNESDLRQFTGTEQWYRHPLVRFVLYTDGMKYVADQGEAYWLLDAVASHQINPKVRNNNRLQRFQLWTLKVKDHKAVLTCQEDDGEKNVVSQVIEYTDFPLSEIHFYVEPMGDGNLVILLPSEH